MCCRDSLEQRLRGLVALDVDDRLADDRTRVGGLVHDLEQRDARPREPGEDRPRDRGPAAMAGQESRVHAERSFTCKCEKRRAHELRPADHEDQLGIELADRLDRLLVVDVRGLDQHRSARLGNFVERTLAGAVRIDRARKRDDPDDLSACAASGLEARSADRVEAHPDRAHLSAMLSSYSTADGGPASRPRWMRIQLCRARRTRSAASPAESATTTITPAPGTSSSFRPARPSTPARRSRRNCSGMASVRRPPIKHARYRPEQEPEEQSEVDVPGCPVRSACDVEEHRRVEDVRADHLVGPEREDDEQGEAEEDAASDRGEADDEASRGRR